MTLAKLPAWVRTAKTSPLTSLLVASLLPGMGAVEYGSFCRPDADRRGEVDRPQVEEAGAVLGGHLAGHASSSAPTRCRAWLLTPPSVPVSRSNVKVPLSTVVPLLITVALGNRFIRDRFPENSTNSSWLRPLRKSHPTAPPRVGDGSWVMVGAGPGTGGCGTGRGKGWGIGMSATLSLASPRLTGRCHIVVTPLSIRPPSPADTSLIVRRKGQNAMVRTTL